MPYRIFIVEDHAVMRQAYVSALMYEADLELCGQAESGEEALEMLQEMTCDLVVVDLALPGMNGLELTRQLLRKHPGLPVVIISGHDERILGERARRAGARTYLSKRGLAGTLASTLRRVLQESAWGSAPAQAPSA